MTMATWTATARLDPNRWVSWDGSVWTADASTSLLLEQLPDGPHGPALMTPVGPVYTPTGPRDATALFLHATALLPGGVIVDGEMPEVPDIPPVPEGAVA